MNTAAKTGITITAVFALFIVFLVSSYFGYANTAVDFETHIETAVEDNRQKLGQYRIGVAEAVGVGVTVGVGVIVGVLGFSGCWTLAM